ncbi:hypothetical protein D4Q52_06140 [Rhodopseudomonas palustris]|uniref:Uncharacterized protein n=1 Tax=Rhodopseudomonas palustris TaxID=1076 RepID=A0A418VJ57_RHOPL|nr:hypothetical protein D4Q52_06140 [Rhodopseudomonas palustris]
MAWLLVEGGAAGISSRLDGEDQPAADRNRRQGQRCQTRTAAPTARMRRRVALTMVAALIMERLID